ncbi:MAG: hypothetical protein KGL39_26735 [Patescibacteria group bacterium]|nr:hypothetical protein [Patescibacteria group bacterium]
MKRVRDPRVTRSTSPSQSQGPVTTITYIRPWLYPKQLEAIFEPKDFQGLPARFSLIEATTKAGKTLGCLLWIHELAWNAKGPGKNFWWIAPIYKQAYIAYNRYKNLTRDWVEAAQKYGFKQIYEPNESQGRITLCNGNNIWFKSGEDSDALYGEDVWGAVIDEASRVRAESWYALRTTLTATQGPARIIGNVKGRKNWFYQLARKAEAGAPGLSYHKITAFDAVEAKVLKANEIEQARSQMPESVFKENYLAEPSADSGNPFGGDEAIDKCIKPLSNKDPVAWGWDLAKKVDWTVGIGLDEDGNCCRFLRFQKPWPETIQIIKEAIGDAVAVVDSTGVGDPVVDILQKSGSGSNVRPYQFTLSSKQKLMEGLAVAIQSVEVSYPEGPITIELSSFEYVYTEHGVRYEIPEGSMQEHDDCVMALALAVHCLTGALGPKEWIDNMLKRMAKQQVAIEPETPLPVPRPKDPTPVEDGGDLMKAYNDTYTKTGKLDVVQKKDCCKKCGEPLGNGARVLADGEYHPNCYRQVA